jgi:hypothetical protein
MEELISNNFPCPACNRIFNTYAGMRQHIVNSLRKNQDCIPRKDMVKKIDPKINRRIQRSKLINIRYFLNDLCFTKEEDEKYISYIKQQNEKNILYIKQHISDILLLMTHLENIEE